MKIRSRLYVSAVLSLILIVIIAFTIIRASITTRTEMSKVAFVNGLVKDTSSLIVLTNEYLRLRNERSADQWSYQLDKIERKIKAYENPELFSSTTEPLQHLKKYLFRIKSEDNLLVRFKAEDLKKEEITKIERSKQMLVEQVLVNSQEILQNMFDIADKANLKVRKIQADNQNIILSLVIVQFVILMANSLAIIRRIGNPIVKLSNEIKKLEVETEDLMNLQLPDQTKPGGLDEIDELLIAFVDMKQRLNRSFLSLHREISVREKAERDLKQEKEFTEATIDCMVDTFFVFDIITGRPIRWNKNFSRITGFSDEEIMKKRAPDDWWGKDDLKRTLALLQEIQQKGHVELEMSLVTKSGTEIPTEYHATSLKDSNGKFKYIVAVGRDITERKALEAEKKRSHEELERRVTERTRELNAAKELAEVANKAKSEFLANISHELRNPMHHILSYSRYGMEKFQEAELEKLNHYFTQIHKSGSRLMKLLNDLLDLSKLEAGKTDYTFEQCNLKHIINEVITEIESVVKEKNLKIEKPTLPEVALIFCDRYKIGQVLRNLLNNAIRYTPEENSIRILFEKGVVELNGETVQGQIISVVDSGVGIPNDELDLIFDKFTQSSKTKTGAGGTGLGLAICKEIISDHKGKIWAENNPEGGAIFKFLLPDYKDQ